jgi:hypothetical protein
VFETKAPGERSRWNDPLPIDQQLGHLPECSADDECGYAERQGTPQSSRHARLHLPVSYRSRGNSVHCTTHDRCIERELEHTDEIVNVDPGHPLSSAARYGA